MVASFAASRSLPISQVCAAASSVNMRTGMGVVGTVDGAKVVLGNHALMREQGIDTGRFDETAERRRHRRGSWNRPRRAGR